MLLAFDTFTLNYILNASLLLGFYFFLCFIKLHKHKYIFITKKKNQFVRVENIILLLNFIGIRSTFKGHYGFILLFLTFILNWKLLSNFVY